MELREYYRILKNNLSPIIYVTVIALIAGYIWTIRLEQTWTGSSILSITRSGAQQTTDYRYDQYYRLEADESFADTISEWLKTPGITAQIFEKAGVAANASTIRSFSKKFTVSKLSAQIIEIRVNVTNEEDAKKIFTSLEDVVEQRVQELNKESRDSNWFSTKLSDRIILQNKQNLLLNLSAFASIGLFIGTFLSLFTHYLLGEPAPREQ